MPHRARPQVRGTHHALAPATADATQAYLALLASTEPLHPTALLSQSAKPKQPAAPSQPAEHTRRADRTAELAYLELLATTGPLTKNRPPSRSGERRFRSHRAPSTPYVLLGDRGRRAVLAAALVTGIGVAGAAATHANAVSAHQATSSPAAAQTAAATTPGATATTPAATTPAATTPAANTPGTDLRATRHSTIATPSPAPSDTTPAITPTTAPTTVPKPGTPTTAAENNATKEDEQTDDQEMGLTSGTAALRAAEAEQAAGHVTTGGSALSVAPLLRKERPQPVLPEVAWVNPMPEGVVTSCFGPRWGRLHAGVDIAAPHGTPIRAAGAGTVVSSGPAQGYGNAVLIDHGNGYLTHYGHMSEITAILGQKVKAGEEIGKEGSTGNSTGPHLHFEVHQGHYKNPIEPTAWMREHGIAIPGCHTEPTGTQPDTHTHD